jgi:hypothetical protein
MNWKYTVIKIVLSIIILVLAYLVYESIMRPLRFNREVATREVKVIERLRDIRSSQQFYKKLNNHYTGNFDTLIHFLEIGEIPVVNIIPDPEDTTFTKTINDTIGFVSVADSLFKNHKNFTLDSLRYIPFSGRETFEIQAGSIERGGLSVSVFEIRAHFREYLKGLDRQLVINHIKSKEDIERFPGLKVGSMEEPSTDGNWE